MTARQGTWRFRRRLMWAAVLFSFVVVLASLTPWVNPEVGKTAVSAAFTLIGAVVLGYHGGAIAHDYLHRDQQTNNGGA